MKHLLQHGRNLLDGTRLKLIGIILMFCDHVHQMFVSFTMPARFNIQWLNMLGRPVFPMFLFMLAEGMHYTRNRKKYLLLLFAGSVVMTLGNYLLQQRVTIEEI
ncbi:MAG: conjugal transfer protein TraX [Candidatus Peribacteria bacterium]|jgi:hypothetical protein|nr:conjugal transfer protein TraX [Candidatus Peribacteria bacterium]